MGQAKRRGTFEERAQAATIRNAQLEKNLPKGDLALQDYKATHGMKRLSTRLVMAGVLASLSQFQVAGKVRVLKAPEPEDKA